MARKFIVDSNVFLEAANTYYAFDRVPGFWSWLSTVMSDQQVRTIEPVRDEINYPKELVDWLDEQASRGVMIDISDPSVQAEYKDVVSWVIQQSYGPQHVTAFLDKADPWVIACAKTHGFVVVTQEQLAGPGTKKIKIPNVCNALGVDCCSTFEMLSELNATF